MYVYNTVSKIIELYTVYSHKIIKIKQGAIV